MDGVKRTTNEAKRKFKRLENVKKENIQNAALQKTL